MNPQELIQILENPSAVNPQQTEQLEKILKKYPFFQAARAVNLKGLYEEKSFSYNTELKKTAAYTTDRSVLFDYITSEEFNQDKIALQIKLQEEQLRNITVFEAEEVFGKKSIAIDEAIKMKKTESDRVMDPDLFEKPLPKTEAVPPKELEERTESSKEPQLANPGTPLEFDSRESHSFSEWLRLTSAKPIERNEPETERSRERKFELIDDFISKSPRLTPSKPSNTSNLAQERITPPEALMTETLARVYLEQKNYKKAIQAYKILILKNPEKSGFFADQIRAIKNLQENNTGKE
ncbi:hypothetical protein LZ575_19805 [Antarcticibacterium sp. 1MA-6-2]|uniref:hypothetical protein n=1 Tax=Antarcticibacterium sp. 1MA-6-2 TaxID=2908210 RepID=UPI001F240263|nr:hypothetical protein [Antarcticibacterium sp. 1MA-6-2]UJH90916.1 hypothetical protein LZ575_19805 [Antarcticibacterium sp. 1MA-6-2]